MFSELLNLRNSDHQEQLALWNAENLKHSDTNPAIFAYLNSNKTMTVFSSGDNTVCWQIRDGKVVNHVNDENGSRTVWTVEPNDFIVGICGSNDHKSFDPLMAINFVSDLEGLIKHLDLLFDHDLQYSSVFVGQIRASE